MTRCGALWSLDLWPKPPAEVGVRWTPGLAFAVVEPVGSGELESTPRAVLGRLAPDVVGVYKHDVVDALGRLDPHRRLGGWGAVSVDITRQIGGTWTARSARGGSGIREPSDERTWVNLIMTNPEHGALRILASGRAFRFGDWPNPEVPNWRAGVYTVWYGSTFLYVGMAGRGMAPDAHICSQRLFRRGTEV